jgi:hypothetical protein
MLFSKRELYDIEILSGENEHLKFDIVPAIGGKISSIFNKKLKKEFLWRNINLPLEKYQPGDEYDSRFYGGMDELIPNDIPEKVDSLDYPDHGELWTTALGYQLNEDSISVSGKLKTSGLFYKKTIWMDKMAPIIYLDYTIRNEDDSIRHFLWKMHAALKIEAGDKLVSPAKKAKVVDLDYSRFSQEAEFQWPLIENKDASIVPTKENGMDFFYLYDAADGNMSFLSEGEKHLFSFIYDKKIFPYQWYFASYGGFLNHYTAVLEPCTSMPLSVNDALRLGQCTVLAPGEEINTTMRIYAGENRNQ